MEIDQQIKVAVDAVVFGYEKGELFVLFIKQKFGQKDSIWALPGGLVKNDESLIDAVKRELKEETNISANYLEQLYTFGDNVKRDHRNRVISVAYFALIDSNKFSISASSDAEDVAWFKMKETPTLAFDHQTILETAYARLKAKLTYQPIGFDLLPKEFLFSDLESLYSSILHKEIDRRNFRKKILSYGFIHETKKFGGKKSGRPAKLFKFNILKYKELENKGFLFEIKFA